MRATTVTVNATDAGASEDGLDSGTFTFTRTGSTATALTVKYAVAGTATEGSDYQNLGTSVTFPAGSSTVSRTVVPIQDSLIEDDETVILTLVLGNGYHLGSPISATVTLTSDDTNTVSVNATNAAADEAGLTTGTFTFTRTGDTSAALTVTYAVTGNATAGSDYQSLGTSVTFAAGSSTATKTVTPLQDTLVESNETVILTLASGSGYTVGTPSSATVTLTSDDTNTVTVNASDVTADEAGLTTGIFTFTRTGDTSAALTVTYAVTGTATVDSDYTSLGTSVSFAAGSSTATKTVTPLQDTLVESDETVILTLVTGSGYAVGNPSSATVTITSEDVVPTVTVTASDATATEADFTTGAFTFNRSGDTSSALTVNYTIGGTATAGSDYTALGTSVPFAVGASTVTMTVAPHQDSLIETDETVILTLADGTGYTVGIPDSATVTLRSDDTLPGEDLTIKASDISGSGVHEFQATGNITVMGEVNVRNGVQLIISAGKKIVFQPGFKVESGGRLNAHIGTNP